MFERMKRGGQDDPASRNEAAEGAQERARQSRGDPDSKQDHVYEERTRVNDSREVGARDADDRPTTPAGERGAVREGTTDTGRTSGGRGAERDHGDDRTMSAKERVHDVRERQRAEYGGFNFGAAFFGWLVAVGLGALLTALLSAGGAAVGLTNPPSESQAVQSADTISIAGGIALLVVLFIAYYAGGYVAGRMSRFNGGKQGIGVWVIALAVTIALAVLGAIAGAEYNVLAQLNLPRIPVDEGTLATGSLIALLVVLVVTLLAAFLGGKQGVRYHKKVDRAGLTY